MVVNPMIQIQKSPLTNPRSTVRNPSHANQNPHKTHAAPSAQGSRSGEHESCSEQKKGTKPSSNLKPMGGLSEKKGTTKLLFIDKSIMAKKSPGLVC